MSDIFKKMRNKKNEVANYDIYETSDYVMAHVELEPEVDRDNISISVTAKGIQIETEDEAEQEITERGITKYYGAKEHTFRYIPIPAPVEAEKAEGWMKNGVLNIKIPKIKD